MKNRIALPVCFLLAFSLHAFGQTKEKPYENTLGMKFVPVPEAKVLFSIWDTRVQDYRAYADANPGVDGEWKIKQPDDNPVVLVSWDDAKAFCAWLTAKERKEGKIGNDQEYRLPTDKEWSIADGTMKYPWGAQWPPPKGAGNYGPGLKVDDFVHGSPVGSFKPNQYGLYDMGGNVWQWCEDIYKEEMNAGISKDRAAMIKDASAGSEQHVQRGSSWDDEETENLLCSIRNCAPPKYRMLNVGFRVVLAMVQPAH